MVKKSLLVISLLFLMVGCSDPITDHNKDVIQTINHSKDVKDVQNSKNYFDAVQAAYNEFIGNNGVEPTLDELYVNYQVDGCNNDKSSPDYALRVENGYLHIYCNDTSYRQDTMKMREE